MATFTIAQENYLLHSSNNKNGSLSFDLGSLEQPGNVGSVEPGQDGAAQDFHPGGTLEKGNVVILGIRGDNNPGFQFWSGSGDQYISLIGGNGYTVTRDPSEISELTGNGFRVMVDGGGANDPDTIQIWIQVYNA